VLFAWRSLIGCCLSGCHNRRYEEALYWYQCAAAVCGHGSGGGGASAIAGATGAVGGVVGPASAASGAGAVAKRASVCTAIGITHHLLGRIDHAIEFYHKVRS
jgi:hypothetical protein